MNTKSNFNQQPIQERIFAMKKLLRQLLTTAICLCMVILPTYTVSAASTVKLSEADVSFDTLHGHYFHVEGNPNRVLNQYTDGLPCCGTKVTTWTKIDEEPTQAWDIGYLSNGNFIIVTNPNRTLAIDYDRNYTYPDVQLYTWINDYYDDVVLSHGIHYGDTYIKLLNRDRYLYVTNNNTGVYDANGKTCQWSTYITNWVHIC